VSVNATLHYISDYQMTMDIYIIKSFLVCMVRYYWYWSFHGWTD